MSDHNALDLYLRHRERLQDQISHYTDDAELGLTFNQFLHYSDQVTRYTLMLQSFLETSALVVSSLDPETVLERVLDTVIDIAGAERAYIMLQQPDDDALTIVAARRWDHESITDADAVYSSMIVDIAMHKREPVVALNAQDDPLFRDRESVVAHQLRSMLCVPLVLHDRTIGVLYADNRINRHVFSDKILLPVMHAFANYVTIALENARRYNETGDVRWVQIQVANQRLPHPLTTTELQVLSLICRGLTNNEIATELTVEKSTVRKHINNIYSKIDAEGNRSKAVAVARELGLC